jgi:hypothetical protein
MYLVSPEYLRRQAIPYERLVKLHDRKRDKHAPPPKRRRLQTPQTSIRLPKTNYDKWVKLREKNDPRLVKPPSTTTTMSTADPTPEARKRSVHKQQDLKLLM